MIQFLIKVFFYNNMKLTEIKNYEDVKKLYTSKNYQFREGKMALNLGAMRSKNSQSDTFDDLGWCAWTDENNMPQIQFFWLTTDPGKHWLLTPMKSEGTIIMVPGQYKEVFGVGKHNNSYECFRQLGNMAYVRDNNKDTLLDFSLYRDPKKAKTSIFWGVNNTKLHRASAWKIVELVGPYSAGCQVVKNPQTFKKLIELRDKSVLAGYKRWDYTLFEEL